MDYCNEEEQLDSKNVKSDLPPITVKVSVPYKTEREAEIVYEAIRVEEEPTRSGTTKTLKLNGKNLEADFESREARTMRIAINAFFENIVLANSTIETFGPPMSEKYSHYK